MAAYYRSVLLAFILLKALSAAAPIRVEGFAFNGVSNRFLTPNGDHRNDNVAFNFSNPFDASGSVKIYDMRGHLLTTIPITAGTGATSVVWDGHVNGTVVPMGVYIYVLSVQDVTASGALVVVR
ncbi:MAG: T9SS type B sorting domain-containing protein [Elusimicrobiota bacterium]